MVKIIKKRNYYSVIYVRFVCSNHIEYKETFFDEKYAKIRAAEIEAGVFEKEYKLSPDMPVLDYFDIYLKSIVFKNNTAKTYETYVSIISNYLIPYFKGKTLKQIDQKFILQLNELIEKQRMIGNNHINKEDKLISRHLKDDIISLLNQLFEFAMKQGVYQINPMQYFNKNYETSRFATKWDIETLNILMEKSKGQRIYLILHCLFGTELKIKEILAMTWNQVHIDDINLTRNTCYVEADRYLGRKRIEEIEEMKDRIIKVFPSVINGGNKTRLFICQSENPRKIFLPIKIARLLRKWKQYQDREKSVFNDSYEDNNLVISLINGKACESRVINKEFDALKYLYKLPDVKLAKLNSFSKQRILYKEKYISNREYFYLSYYQIDDISFEKNKIRQKIIQAKRFTNNGDYHFVDLKNISIPRKNSIDILKAISLIKNNPKYTEELTSILNE